MGLQLLLLGADLQELEELPVGGRDCIYEKPPFCKGRSAPCRGGKESLHCYSCSP
jgi:hypothetical protein